MIQYLEPLIRQALRQLPDAELTIGYSHAQPGNPLQQSITDPDFQVWPNTNTDLGKAKWAQIQWPINKYSGLILRITNTSIHHYDNWRPMFNNYNRNDRHPIVFPARPNNGKGIYQEIQWEDPNLIEILTAILSIERTNMYKAQPVLF